MRCAPFAKGSVPLCVLLVACGTDPAPSAVEPDAKPEEVVGATTVGAPAWLGSDPASPSSGNAPTLNGTAAPGAEVTIYATADCSGPVETTALADADGAFETQVTVADDTVSSFTATAGTANDAVSGCSGVLEYTEDSSAPDPPELQSTLPPSPSATVTEPMVLGQAEPRALVSIFTTADCAGEPVGEAEASGSGQFAVEISVAGDTATDLHGLAQDAAGNVSECSTALAYVHDSSPPAAPSWTGTAPESPDNDNAPVLLGTAPPGAEVRVFKAAACAGPAAGVAVAGDDGTFEVPAAVADDSTTIFTASAVDGLGKTSPCSDELSYTEDSTPPAAPELAGTEPASPSPDSADPAVSGSAEPGAEVSLFVLPKCQGAIAATVTADSSGSFSATVSVAEEQTTTITSLASDAAGNASDCSAPLLFTHDGVVPAPPIWLGSEPDAPADDDTPVLSGTGEPLGVVAIYAQTGCTGAVVASTPVDEAGAFSAAVVVPNETVTFFSATVTDSSGHASACSVDLEYEHDGTPPAAPDLSATAPASPSSSSVTPSVSGSGEPGATIAIHSNPTCEDAPLSTGTVDSEGSFELVVGVPANSTVALHATATDLAGNASACSDGLQYVHDDSPPDAPTWTGSTPTSPASEQAPTLTGAAEAGATITIFAMASCGGTAAQSVVTGADGTFQIAVAVTENSETVFSLRATDAAGNASACSAGLTYIEDSAPPAPPAIEQTVPASPSAVSSSPKVIGTAEPGAWVAVHQDAGCGDVPSVTVQASATGSFVAKVTLPANTTTALFARAKDAAGNQSACVAGPIFVHDSTAPGAPVWTQVTPESPASHNLPVLEGLAEPGAMVEVFGMPGCAGPAIAATPSGADGTYSIAVGVADDTVTSMSARATDAAGNTSSCAAPLSYTEDSTPPPMPVLTGTDPPSPAPVAPTLVGHAEPGALVEVFTAAGCAAAPVASGTAAPDGSFSIAVPVGGTAPVDLAARATDAAANVSPCSDALVYVLDAAAPAPLQWEDTLPTSPANENTPTLGGTAEIGGLVTVFGATGCAGVAIETATVGPAGSFVVQLTVADDTTSVFTATVTDAAGNVSDCSAEQVYVEDSAPPDAPLWFHLPASGTVGGQAGAGNTAIGYGTPDCSGEELGSATDIGEGFVFGTGGETIVALTAVDPAGNASPCASGSRRLPLHFEDASGSGAARIGETATGGVPFPKGGLFDSDGMRVTYHAGGSASLATTAVPAQLTPLTRWPDGSIKWLQVDVQPSVATADPGYAAGEGTARYFFEWGPGVSGGPSPDEAVAVKELEAALEVDTGPLTFTIPTDRFGFIRSARVAVEGVEGGVEVLRTDESDNGWVTSTHRLTGLPTRWRADQDAGYSATVELAGPMHAIIRLEGWQRNSSFAPEATDQLGSGVAPDVDGAHEGGFQYTIRIHAYAGSAELRVEHTVVFTHYPYRESVRDVALRLPLALASPLAATLAGDVVQGEVTAVLAGDARASLTQLDPDLKRCDDPAAPGACDDRYVRRIHFPERLANGSFETQSDAGDTAEGWSLSSEHATLLGQHDALIFDPGFELTSKATTGAPGSYWVKANNSSPDPEFVEGAGRFGSRALRVGQKASVRLYTPWDPFGLEAGTKYLLRAYAKRESGEYVPPGFFVRKSSDPDRATFTALQRRLVTDVYTPIENWIDPVPVTAEPYMPLRIIRRFQSCDNYEDTLLLDDLQVFPLGWATATGFGAVALEDGGWVKQTASDIVGGAHYVVTARARCGPASDATGCAAKLVVEWLDGDSSLGSESFVRSVDGGGLSVTVPSPTETLKAPAGADSVRLRIVNATAETTLGIDDVGLQRAEQLLDAGGSVVGQSWLYADVSGDSADGPAGVTVYLRDGRLHYPKQLEATAGGDLLIHLWPADPRVDALDLRRTEVRGLPEWEAFQDEPFCCGGGSQGGVWTPGAPTAEGCKWSAYYGWAGKDNWCADSKAEAETRNDQPGIAKSHELVLRFHAGGPSPPASARQARARQIDAPLVPFVTPAWNTATEVMGRLTAADPGQYPVEERLYSAWIEWLERWQLEWSREPVTSVDGNAYRHSWLGFMNYGCTSTRYIGSQSGCACPVGAEGPGECPPCAGGIATMWPQASWGYYAGRWGWLKNERDIGHTVFVHYLRTGERRALRVAESLARHWLDLDVRHHSEFERLPRAFSSSEGCVMDTPPANVGHGYRHHIDHGYAKAALVGSGEGYTNTATSLAHTYVYGLRDLYTLLGVRRARDVARKVGDSILKWETPIDAATASLGRGATSMLHLAIVAELLPAGPEQPLPTYRSRLVAELWPSLVSLAGVASGIDWLVETEPSSMLHFSGYGPPAYSYALALLDPSQPAEAALRDATLAAWDTWTHTHLEHGAQRNVFYRPSGLALRSLALGYDISGDSRLLIPGEDDWVAHGRCLRADPASADLATECPGVLMRSWTWQGLGQHIRDCVVAPSGPCEVEKATFEYVASVKDAWSQWPYWMRAWESAGASPSAPLERVADGAFEEDGASWQLTGAAALAPGEGTDATQALLLPPASTAVQGDIPVLGPNSYRLSLTVRPSVGTDDALPTLSVRWWHTSFSGVTDPLVEAEAPQTVALECATVADEDGAVQCEANLSPPMIGPAALGSNGTQAIQATLTIEGPSEGAGVFVDNVSWHQVFPCWAGGCEE